MAVNWVLWPTLRVATDAGLTALALGKRSTATMLVWVTVPVLVTVSVNVMVSPRLVAEVALDDLVIPSDLVCWMTVWVVLGSDVIEPRGEVPLAVAELSTLPRSTSACVTVREAVKVAVPLGAIV